MTLSEVTPGRPGTGANIAHNNYDAALQFGLGPKIIFLRPKFPTIDKSDQPEPTVEHHRYKRKTSRATSSSDGNTW